MPAPVSFQLSLAPLPVNFDGTPAEWAAAVINRLTITPSAPWSSFQNGGAIPTSDVGPVLYGGTEWRVFDPGLGAYTYHKQHGAGLVDDTVPLSKLTAGTVGGILSYDAAGRPFVFEPGTAPGGSVLTLVNGKPGWADTFVPTGMYFETTVGSSQSIDTHGAVTVVNFDTVRFQRGIEFDTANRRFVIPANQVWFLYCSLQMEDTDAPSTGVQVVTDIRKSGVTNGIGSTTNVPTVDSRFGTTPVIGTIVGGASDYVDVVVQATEATPAAAGMTVAANVANTRFGGIRLI